MEIYKKIKKRAAISVAVLSLLSFLLLYLRLIYVFESDFTIYGSYFLQYILEAFSSLFVGVAILSGRGYEDTKHRILSALKLSLPRLIYLIPYYYLFYISDGFDSIEALGLLTLRALLLLAAFVIEALFYYLVASFATKKSGDVWDFFKPAKLFDFSSSVSASIFAVCFTRFIFNVIGEGLDVIAYLIDYEEFYNTTEIFYLLGKLLLAFATLFLSHLFFMKIRGYLRRLKEDTEDTEKAES